MPVGVGRAREKQATKLAIGRAQPSRWMVVEGGKEELEEKEWEEGRRGGRRRRRESVLLLLELLLLLTFTVILLVHPRTTVNSSTSPSTPPLLHTAVNARVAAEEGAWKLPVEKVPETQARSCTGVRARVTSSKKGRKHATSTCE
jgi:hypothetical protein